MNHTSLPIPLLVAIIVTVSVGCVGSGDRSQLRSTWTDLVPPVLYKGTGGSAAVKRFDGVDFYLHRTLPSRDWEHVGFLVAASYHDETDIAKVAQEHGCNVLVADGAFMGSRMSVTKYLVGRYTK